MEAAEAHLRNTVRMHQHAGMEFGKPRLRVKLPRNGHRGKCPGCSEAKCVRPDHCTREDASKSAEGAG